MRSKTSNQTITAQKTKSIAKAVIGAAIVGSRDNFRAAVAATIAPRLLWHIADRGNKPSDIPLFIQNPHFNIMLVAVLWAGHYNPEAEGDALIAGVHKWLMRTGNIGLAQGGFKLATFDPDIMGKGASVPWWVVIEDHAFSDDVFFLAGLCRLLVADWAGRYLAAAATRQIEGESAADRVERIGRAVEFARQALEFSRRERGAEIVKLGAAA